MGQQILVRLRPHFDPDAFLPESDVVHTMLHEVGPHPSFHSPPLITRITRPSIQS